MAVFDATMTLRGYADQWGEVAFGPGQDGACSDANAALGVEDGSAVCLGGEGGYLIVSFAGVDCIAEGDLIQTFELGTEAEPYDLLVGPTASATDVNWVACASGASGPTQCTVPALPQL
ncbi:MAG: hypothetical protein P1V51_25235 [Deltaproteobacteria bacterium]|nr:hypothetical protein [Deltaproteobacteria bacterium]